jgi:hypothetical protein
MLVFFCIERCQRIIFYRFLARMICYKKEDSTRADIISASGKDKYCASRGLNKIIADKINIQWQLKNYIKI